MGTSEDEESSREAGEAEGDIKGVGVGGENGERD